MKKRNVALLFIMVPVILGIIGSLFLAFQREPKDAIGFAIGTFIVVIFSLVWIISVDRFSQKNTMRFLKSLAYMYLGKLFLLAALLVISVTFFKSDRLYFTMAFLFATLLTIPVEIWFGLTKKRNDT